MPGMLRRQQSEHGPWLILLHMSICSQVQCRAASAHLQGFVLELSSG